MRCMRGLEVFGKNDPEDIIIKIRISSVARLCQNPAEDRKKLRIEICIMLIHIKVENQNFRIAFP